MGAPLGFLHGIDTIEITGGPRPITTLKSSIIGLVGSAGMGPVNQPVLILGSQRDAVTTFGTPRDDGFTIPQALQAIFDQGGATVVVINVADPATHTIASPITETITLNPAAAQLTHGFVSNVVPALTLSGPYTVSTLGTVTLPSGCTVTAVKDVTDTTTIDSDGIAALPVGAQVIVHYTVTALVLNTDYTLDAGYGTITRVSGGKLIPGAKVSVAYKYVDPTMVESADIIGEIDEDTGLPSGIQVLLSAQSIVHVKPRILCAPGFTDMKPDIVTKNPVAAALEVVCPKLGAVAIVDAPNTTKELAVTYITDYADDPRIYGCYPWTTVFVPYGAGATVTQPPSARIAGMISAKDNAVGFWNSPSNTEMLGILGLSKPIGFGLSDPDSDSNYLNGNFLACIISANGLTLWGNRCADGTFLNVRRTADMIEESIEVAMMWAVDKNITKGFVEAVVDAVNAYIRTLVAQGAILGGDCWCAPSLNTPAVIASGELFVDYEFTPPTPCEHLRFQAHLVNTYVAAIFDGTTSASGPVTTNT